MTQLSLPMLIMSQPHRAREQNRTRVRRILFDERVDHDETRRILEREMMKIQREDSRRWNFNFTEEKPLEGRFDWVRVTEPEATHAYALRRMPYCGAPSAASTSRAAAETPSTAPTTRQDEATACAAGTSTAGDASAKERSRQTSVTDFFLRKRKRSESVKTSTESQASTEQVAKLPKAS